MAIITISSDCPEIGKKLALEMADMMGWPMLSRSEIVEKAQASGINIGRLEVSMVKAHIIREKLVREKELFLAFSTAMICENARDGNLIYHGMAGHLLLPGITHRIRIGLVVPKHIKVQNTMEKLSLSRDKALHYIDQLDEDIKKWMWYVHKVDLMDPKYYDFLINFQTMSLSNTLPLLERIAKLPDFHPNSKSIRAIEDLRLAARAKVLLGLDARTRNMDLGIRASHNGVTVTYMPSHEPLVPVIYEILKELKGAGKILCTTAETRICWVAEKFNYESNEFQLAIKLARRWGAAVELIRLVPGEDGNRGKTEPVNYGYECGPMKKDCPEYTGGVEYDEPEPLEDDESGMTRALEELIAIGRSGGGQIVYGAKEELLHTIQRSGSYSMVIIGDIFLERSHQARVRQTRELAMELRERVKAPVITASELHSRFVFGKKHGAKFLFYTALVIGIYALVFYNQQIVMDFLGGETHQRFKWLSCAAVGLFIPFVAYAYSKVTGMILKIVGID